MFQALLAKPLVKGAIGFLRAIPPAVWFTLALLIGLWLFGNSRYEAGRRFELDKAAAAEAKRKQQVAELAFDLSLASSRVEVRTVTRIERGATITKTITQKVPYYVPSDTADLPGGFRLLHDAAALATDPAPASAIADAAPVPAQDAAATVVENYGIAHRNAITVEAWQEWWKAVDLACKKSDVCLTPEE